MKIYIARDYNELSKQAADDLIQMVKGKSNPVVCTASGDTPAGLYESIVERTNNKEIDISDWYFLGLDEWSGLNGDDEGSCRFHVNNQLFDPLKVKDDKIIFFDGRADDPEAECQRIESFIQKRGGIDVAILGLGMNGHIGMNEPGTSITTRSHISKLDPLTQQIGQKYFKKEQPLTTGITLGLATLMESKHIILLVNGAKKAAVVKQVLEGEISEKVPGSLLRNHPSVHIHLDKEAAQLLLSK